MGHRLLQANMEGAQRLKKASVYRDEGDAPRKSVQQYERRSRAETKSLYFPTRERVVLVFHLAFLL